MKEQDIRPANEKGNEWLVLPEFACPCCGERRIIKMFYIPVRYRDQNDYKCASRRCGICGNIHAIHFQ